MLICAFRLRTPDDACFMMLSADTVQDAYEHSIALAATVGMMFYDLGRPSVYCFGSDELIENIKRADDSARQWERSGYTTIVVGAVGRYRVDQSNFIPGPA